MSSDVHDPATRSYNMSRIRGKNTKPERLLRSLLHRAGFRFRIHDSRLPGKPDIVLPRYRTVIFVHGCFWHRHEGCRYATTPKARREFWENKFADTVKRDLIKQKQLRDTGWSVIVVWECELMTQPETILEQIAGQMRQKADS